MTIVSVVVPAYNAEDYIAECITSVVQQPNYKGNVEIIVVVDGATDGTLVAARNASRGNEDTIRILTQENFGASAARNYGLAHVSSKYVTFLDADDFWQPDFLSTVLHFLADEPDLIEYDALLIDSSGTPYSTLKIAVAPHGVALPVKPGDFLTIFRCYTWARICRTSIVRAHPFPAGRRFEDSATTPWYYWESGRTISIGQALVAYRQHPASVLATPRPQDVDEVAQAIREAAAMYAQTGVEYWQRTSYRIFHFACQRIISLPFRTWLDKVRVAQSAVAEVPRPPGLGPWLLLHATPLYVALLFLKRKLM